MRLGGQTVTLRTFTDGTTRDRLNKPVKVPTNTAVSGVLMRTLSGQETVNLTDVAVQVWRCTLPPVAAALNATAADELDFDGDTYQVTVVEKFFNHRGSADHVRITCQLQAS